MKTRLFVLIGGLLLLAFSLPAQDILEQEFKKVSDQLAPKILATGKKRVAVANFINLEGQETALGRALAEELSNGLINTALTVIDRSELARLIKERHMLNDGLLDRKDIAELGRMQGIDYVIIGTSTPLDRTVRLVIKAVDVQQGVAVASTSALIQRTDAINTLISDRLDGIDENQFKPNPNPNPSGDSMIELPVSKCVDGGYVNSELCLESHLKESIVVYKLKSEGYMAHNDEMKVSAGSRNCYGKILAGRKLGENEYGSMTYTIYFRTDEEDLKLRKYGTMRMTVDGCKLITRVINKERLSLQKTKPN